MAKLQHDQLHLLSPSAGNVSKMHTNAYKLQQKSKNAIPKVTKASHILLKERNWEGVKAGVIAHHASN